MLQKQAHDGGEYLVLQIAHIHEAHRVKIRDVQDAVKEYLPEDCNPAIVESLQFQYEEPDIDEYLERLQEETEGLDCEPG